MNKGFTLLELLVSMTIFALIAASVYSSLYLGIKVWKQESAQDESLQETERSLDAVARRVRCAFMNPEQERIKFIGSRERLDFFSVNEAGSIENVVFYRVLGQDGTAEGEYPLVAAIKNFRQLDNEDPPRVVLINKKVPVFFLRYFDAKEQAWYDEWPEESRLPDEVVVELGCSGKETGAPVILKKYIAIPMAHEIDMSGSPTAQ